MTTNTRTTITLAITFASSCLVATSAPRKSESARALPASITAISGQDLTHFSTLELTTVRDLTSHVPHQPNGQPVYIRGIVDGGGVQNPLLLGGLRDIESVEVLRGPQGALFGKDAVAGVITVFAAAGHLDNVTYDPYQDHSSSYISAGINYNNSFDLGAGKLSLSAGLAYTHYDKKLMYRNGDDNLLHDFYLQGRYTQQLSPSAQLDINLDLNYGEHGTVAGDVTWAGVLQSPLFSFKADTELTFRTDGAALDAPGLVHRSGIHLGGFREKDWDYHDSTRLSLSHELIYQRNREEGYYARLELGTREWKQMDEYDSDRITVVGGLYGRLPCGAQYRFGAGGEFREYDDNYLDDRSVPTVEGAILGRVGDVRYSIGAKYGIHDKFANWGKGGSVDMEGLEIGARFNVPLTPKLDLGMALESSYLKAESSRRAMGHIHYLHGGVSLGYKLNESTRVTLNAGLDRVTVNNGWASRTDTFGSYSLGVKYSF